MNPASSSNSRRNWLIPAVCAVACVALGTASGLLTASGPTQWYQALQKPPGNPPPWVFGPVWTMLYTLMGIAVGRLIVRKAWSAVRLFVVQLLLNLAWTPVFFGAHQIVAALVIIILLWLTLLLTIRQAWKVDRISAWLLIPYLAWVSYATYLNGAIAWLNR